jgi:periplasmic protein TonB
VSDEPSPSLVDRDFREAERVLRSGREERPRLAKALVATLALHALLLWGRLPGWGSEPVRVEAPQQMMKVQFLLPPPPPVAPPRPPEPERKKIPRPDLTPDEPEPVTAPPAPPPAPELQGPTRVSAGQGPGVIRRVEPIYPPFARAGRIEGVVVLDAVIRKDGTVDSVSVLESAHPVLERSAADALRRWRFTPGDREVIMTLTVRFVLEK